MKQFIIIATLFGLLVSCRMPASGVTTAKTPYEVIPIAGNSVDTINSVGAFYALPRQRLNIDVVVRKQEFIKGPYAEFAEKLLGIKVSKENYSIYNIDHVSVSQKSEVDPKQIYFVQFNDSKLTLQYEHNLLIKGVNKSEEETTQHYRKDSPKQVTLASNDMRNATPLHTFGLVERNDTVVSMDTQAIQRYEIRTIKTEKTPLQKAEEIVANISKVREDRNKLLTGYQEVNYEAAAIKYMADEYNRMEDEYIRLFTGTTKVSYETRQFDFLPENRDSLTIELAEFSQNHGLSHGTSLPNNKKLALDIILDDQISNAIQTFSSRMYLPKAGFYYTIPNLALVKVLLDNQVIFSKQMPFSQFGSTQALAPSPLQLEFSPQTGEISNIKADSF
ncbi:MAG: DUF4831 family protein [Bacteroidales bacterium]|jgi:hypothetical protein|nr:DUF4831 family protein [Bacteroidales bacterium]